MHAGRAQFVTIMHICGDLVVAVPSLVSVDLSTHPYPRDVRFTTYLYKPRGETKLAFSLFRQLRDDKLEDGHQSYHIVGCALFRIPRSSVCGMMRGSEKRILFEPAVGA